jgi:phosphatidylglycerol---prolipoprotein diacylglyceryl transferase
VFPILFRVGNLPITSFGLMMLLSFLAGAWAIARMLKRYSLEPAVIWDMLAGIAIGGILGAKLYHLALHWQDVLASPRDLILSRAGLVWYGGLFGGVLAYYLQIRARKLPVAVMFDATAPALMLAIAVGRVGCFLVGDDYGVYTAGPLGVPFPQGTPPSTAEYLRSVGNTIPATIADSTVVPVHATQLYETVIALVLFAVLWQLGKRRLKPGVLFAGFMGLYAVERFFIEFLRAKDDRFLMGLSTSQMMSVFLLIGALALWQRQRRKPDWNAEAAQATVINARAKPA